MSIIKADKYINSTIAEILISGNRDINPRPKDTKGNPAHSAFVTQKVFKYNIFKGEFPITTLRTTALKGAFHDIEAIYINQTNLISEMHTSIHSWWKDFTVSDDCIGQTYGHTVRRYNLVNKLLSGMEKDPFSRRHMINLWQEQQMIEDPKALVPCAYQTNWSVREVFQVREVDLTLHQRSQDFCMTSSINPAQYVMLGMMVCNHLTFKTGIEHRLKDFLHVVQNCHIYESHFIGAKEILERESLNIQPIIKLNCKPKDFYSHTIEDFDFILPGGIKKLKTNLEIMI